MSEEFEIALRAHLQSKFLNQFPPEFLKMRVGEFLQLATIQRTRKRNDHFYDNFVLETPKTATRKSVRQQQNQISTTLSSISKSVKRNLFPLTTPSKSSQVPSASTPHLTIKSVKKPQSEMKPLKSNVKSIVKQQPFKSFNHQINSPSTPSSTGIVQFQLDDGKVVDLDFSRSPESTLQVLGNDALGEVKAKIETYTNQFMKYLKFFKKFKPSQ